MAALPADLSSPQTLPGQAQVQVAPEPSVMKLTRGHSCVLCQQRKVRCDKNKPCANCVKAQAECRVIPPQPPRRRRKKPHERELIERLKKYESLLAQHGVNFEPIGHDLKPSDSAPVDEVDDLEHGIEGLKTSPSSTGQDLATTSQPTPDKPFRWFPYYREFKSVEDSLRDSSDEEGSDGPTLHHAFDTMFDNQDGFPFVIGGSFSMVTDLHPEGMQIFQLWQIYLENVNPLLKLTHAPTLQGQIISAAADTSKVPKPLEALMFSIYFIAITSMSEDGVQNAFKEEKSRLLSKYHHGCQQALINAGFMRSPDINVLQAYFVYLLCVRQYVDPRSLFCLIGIAVRVAQRLGLHRDGEQFGLPPFEVEMRRRLWWQLCAFDKRIAEMTGSTITALSSSRGDCRWPLNINDTDLHVHAKDRITPYVGPTEMLFSLTRIEITAASRQGGLGLQPNLGSTPGKPRVQYSPSPSSPDVVTHVATQTLPDADLESFCTYMENTYLKHCDPKIPFHLFTLLLTRQNLCKLRVIEHLSRSSGHAQGTAADASAAQEQALREAVFVEALRTIEYDNIIQSTDSLKGFMWYTYMHFPLPAYIFLASELRNITSGDLCERAWQLISENHERRHLTKNLRSPMHIALGSLMLKAWEAHEVAEAQLGKSVKEPRLITVLKERARKFAGNANQANRRTNSNKDNNEGPSAASADVGPASSAGGGAFPQPPGVDMSAASSPANPVDANAMFPTFDGINQAMFSAAMPGEMDFGQIDWTSFMQGYSGPGYGGMGGYSQFTHPSMQAMPGPHQR